MDSFLTNLKQDLQCSLCNNTLTDPKLLQCFHTFCKSCIQRNAQLKEQVHIFMCPKCSSETLFQELNNVEALQPSPLHSRMLQILAFSESEKSCSVSATHSPALWHCFDCDRSLCDECLKNHAIFTKDHQVVSLSDVKKEDLESMLRREHPCKTHLNHTLEFYCKDCDVLVCFLCLKDDHKDHKTMTLQEFIATEKYILSENLEEIEKLQCDEIEKKRQEEIAVKMKSDTEKAKEEVKKITKTLVKCLLDKEQQLLKEIQRSEVKADRNLRIIRHIPAAQEYIKNIIANGIASDIVNNHEVKCFERLIYKSFEKFTSGIDFEHNEDLNQQVLNAKLGNVRYIWKSNPILSEIHVDCNPKVLEKAKLSVVTKTSTENLNYDDCDVVDIQISPADDVKVEDKAVKNDGKIEVVFMPRVPGQFTAEVKLNGNPVSNSPLVMDVKAQHIKESEKSKLENKWNTGSGYFIGIAVNKTNSRIAVADLSLHCVRVFNMDGELLLVYGGKGSQQGQLMNPHGLVFLNDVDLVIVDSGNNRLCIVNTVTGTLVKIFGCQGNGNGEFCNPCGVHVDDNCNIIVSDTDNCRIQVFTKDGDYQYQFTVPNQDKFSPQSTVTHNGLFYVSDWKNGVIHVIQMEDCSPTRLSTIGGKGVAVGQLQYPYGLAIDNDHNLLVCDYSSRLVNKFTLDGRFIGKTSQLQFSPQYSAVLNDGQVLCTSWSKSNIIYCFL